MVCGSSQKGIGVKLLVDVIRKYVPAPDPACAYAGHDMNDHAKAVSRKCLPSEPMTAVVWKTYIDQFAGRFNYLKVLSGELMPDTDVLNATRNVKERIGKLFTMVGNKQFDLPKITAGDIGVVVKLDRTATRDTLADAKSPAVMPVIEVPHPVFSYAIESAKKGDEDKIGQAFARVTDENPTITYQYNAETRQTVLSGMGEMQLDIILKSLKEKNKLEIITKIPRIAYRETITKKSEAQYKHKKQTGGRGQYGHVVLRVGPNPGEGFKFGDEIVGGVVPKQYIPAVQKGVEEALTEGVLAGYPVTDVEVVLTFGSYHTVDSSELAFKIAGSQAFKEAVLKAGPSIQEPIYDVEITVPEEHMGDVISDLNGKRGRVQGMDQIAPGTQLIKAQVPLGELHRYSIDLRSFTRGRATYTMKYSHYEEAPANVVQDIIAEAKKAKEEESKK